MGRSLAIEHVAIGAKVAALTFIGGEMRDINGYAANLCL